MLWNQGSQSFHLPRETEFFHEIFIFSTSLVYIHTLNVMTPTQIYIDANLAAKFIHKLAEILLNRVALISYARFFERDRQSCIQFVIVC